MLVGVSAYSDYPTVVADIEVVSDAFTVDQERLKLLAPDLVLAWQSGTPAHVVDELQNGGYRVEVIRTRGLDDIAAAIRRIGTLTDRAVRAEEVAVGFEDGLHALRDRYVARDNVTVFYQVSLKPLYTINGAHYIGELIELCGGKNIFSDLSDLAPSVTVEAVVDRNPEVILAANADGDGAFAEWRRWPHLLANRYGNNFSVDSDEIARPSIRLVAAAAEICEHLETARQRRSMDGKH
jgi:iron complex transport system substrate-binding protein